LKIDLNYLRRHYASLSDEGLQEVDETELVDDARRIYDEEIAARGLQPLEEDSVNDEDDVETAPLDAGDLGGGGKDEVHNDGLEPDWLSEGVVAATFVARRGTNSEDSALEAQEALEAAGIQCHVSPAKIERPQNSQPREELRIMVPGKMALEAESVLDKEIFNREIEAQWKTHFQMLSDDELRAVDLEVLVAGLKDRIARVTRAYEEELTQRQ
jgi:hypothetical protein